MFSPSSGSLNSLRAVASVARRAGAGAAAVCVDGAAGAGAAFVAGAEVCFAGATAPLSTVKITWPTLTFCPSLTRISFIVPVTDEGTSTTALSVSSSITGWPSVMVEPGEIIRRTSSPWSMFSPSSGNLNSVKRLLSISLAALRLGHFSFYPRLAPWALFLRRFAAADSQHGCRLTERRIGFLRINAEVPNRFLGLFGSDLFRGGQCIQRGQHDVFGIYFEEVAQGLATFAAAKTVRTQSHQRARHPAGNGFRQNLHVVRRGHKHSLRVFQALTDKGYLRRLTRMQHIPALTVVGLAVQPFVAGHAPDIGSHAVLFFQNLLGLEHLVHNGAAAEKLGPEFCVFLFGCLETI